MAKNLSEILSEVNPGLMKNQLDDIIFTVLEEYGQGFVRWFKGRVFVIDNNRFRMGGTTEIITFPEVIQEYRKYLSQQNMEA